MAEGHGRPNTRQVILDPVWVSVQHEVRVTTNAGARAVEREAMVQASTRQTTSARRHAIERMADDVMAVRAALLECQEQLAVLTSVERARPPAPDEVDQVRGLQWQAEQLRWQLTVLRDQFDQVGRVATGN